MFADLIDIHVFHCTCISFIVKRLENFLICAKKDHIIIIIINYTPLDYTRVDITFLL